MSFVDTKVVDSMAKQGRLHEWTYAVSREICHKHDLCVTGGKPNILDQVISRYKYLHKQSWPAFAITAKYYFIC